MKIKLGDFAIVLLIVFVSIAGFFFANQSGDTVIVEVDGKVIASFNLNDTVEYKYEGKYTNIISIKDGKAFIGVSDCPDNTCVYSGVVNSGGRVICCLPNKLVLRVEKSNNRTDVITG